MALTFGAGVSFGGGIALGILPLGSPTISTSTALSTSSASVTFVPPTELGGAPIKTYTVTSNPGNISVTVPGNTTTAVVSGLSQGQTYTFTVRATNDFGASPLSSTSSNVAMITVPGAPTISTATVIGPTSISVAFIAPASNGGATITSYRATSSPGAITSTSTSSPILVTGLTQGQSYTFTVQAINSAGAGSASGSSNSAVPAVVPGSQSYTTPGTYSWIAPSGITSVSVVAVGAGATSVYSYACGSSAYYGKGAGGGGALAYKNNISVTPGNSYNVVVGATSAPTAGSSNFYCSQVYAGGGTTYSGAGGNVAGAAGVAGGCGGKGGGAYKNGCTYYSSGGGGGAGGYSGSGGAGGGGAVSHTGTHALAGTCGSGGGGGGGSSENQGGAGYWTGGGGGGGVGLFGEGSSGAGGSGMSWNSSTLGSTTPAVVGGKGGSGGADASNLNSTYTAHLGGTAGGAYGGGGGGTGFLTCGIPGGGGAVRIVWPGNTRRFPSTCVGTP